MQHPLEIRPAGDEDAAEICAIYNHGIAGRQATFETNPRTLEGVGEHAVYVDPEAQGRGIGRLLLEELAATADRAGYYKLTSRVFTTNLASLATHRAAGFYEVGVQLRHGRLDGQWKDCMLVERLLGPASA